MKNNKKWAALGVSFLLVAIVGLSLVSPVLWKVPLRPPNEPDYRFSDITISQVENGRVTWELAAKEATVEKGATSAKLREMKGIYWQAENDPIHLQAERTEIKLESSDMVLENASANFKIQNSPVTLYAGRLFWFAKERFFEGWQSVRIQAEELALFGNHLEVKIPIQKMKISQNSTAKIYVSPTLKTEKEL